MKFAISFFAFLLICLNGASAQMDNQIIDQRIQQIKSWYNEAQESRNSGTLIQLDTHWNEVDYGLGEKVTFPKIRKFTQLTEEISLIEIEAFEFDGGNNIEMYLHNGDAFFLFSFGGAEDYFFETRLYFNEKGNCIRFLERNNGGDPDLENFEELPHNNLNPTDEGFNLSLDFYQNELSEFGHEELIKK